MFSFPHTDRRRSLLLFAVCFMFNNEPQPIDGFENSVRSSPNGIHPHRRRSKRSAMAIYHGQISFIDYFCGQSVNLHFFFYIKVCFI